MPRAATSPNARLNAPIRTKADMISLIADTLTFSSIRQIAELVAGPMATLKIIAAVLFVVWLALFLSSEILDAIQRRNRRTPSNRRPRYEKR